MSRDVKPITLSFRGGLNTYSDETAVADDQLVEALNVDMDLDGSARNRPPFTEYGETFPYLGEGFAKTLGWFYLGGVGYLLASDGVSSTYAWDGGAWQLITNTYSATAMVQYQDEAWLLAPWTTSMTKGGGKWTPNTGFKAEPNMPRGTTITSYKERLFVARGRGAVDGSKIYYSNVFGLSDFWPNTPNEQRVASGDGQDIVYLTTYYDNLLVFRSESIWTWGYSSSPNSGQISVIVPGIGLESADTVAVFENAFYFMYDSKAYLFMNNRAEHINPHVPFRSIPGVELSPSVVSVFNRRVIFSFRGSAYVFSLLTNTWTRWKSDKWGPFGKITQNAFDEVEVAYTVAAKGTGGTESRTQLIHNSGPVNGVADRKEWEGKSAGTRAFVSTGGPLNAGGYYRWTQATALAGVESGWSLFGNPLDVTPGATEPVSNAIPVTAGQKIALSAYLRTSALRQFRIAMRIHTGAGAWASSVAYSEYTDVGAEWTRVGAVFTAETNGYVAFRVMSAVGAVPAGTWLDGAKMLLEKADAVLGWYNGASKNANGKAYTWNGAPNESDSREITVGSRKFLRAIDRVTSASEQMTCVLQTKNYSFEVPSNFKILHRWGLDIRFQDRVLAQAVPITNSSLATWDQLLNYNWDQLVTWDNPLGGDQLTVETEYDTPAIGPSRKYVKLRKRLRFRQVYFRVEFDTDGSFSSAPAQLFSILTFVDTRQGVVKALS